MNRHQTCPGCGASVRCDRAYCHICGYFVHPDKSLQASTETDLRSLLASKQQELDTLQFDLQGKHLDLVASERMVARHGNAIRTLTGATMNACWASETTGNRLPVTVTISCTLPGHTYGEEADGDIIEETLTLIAEFVQDTARMCERDGGGSQFRFRIDTPPASDTV